MKDKLLKLNLGCGKDIKEGYVNVDFENFKGVDKVFDLNVFPYPFEDNSCDEILMNNILEHLDNPYKVLQELWRMCIYGGNIKLIAPHFSCANTWGDIQHKRGFSYSTWEVSNIIDKFKVIKRQITFPPSKKLIGILAKRFPYLYEAHFAYWFPAIDIEVTLEVKK